MNIMKTIARRDFLVGAGAVAATSLFAGRARAADSFGITPAVAAAAMLPSASLVDSVLEVYLYGGLSPWETLYYVDDFGLADGRFWYQYEDNVLGPDALDSNAIALASCGLLRDDAAPTFFAQDELLNDVKLGPYAYALNQRPDLIDRMRLVVQRHDLLPHEAAVPYALTGKRVGQPSMAGLGAHIQRYYQANDPAALTRKTPYSYVLASANAIPSDNTAAFVATGTHRGRARPLRINVDAAAQLQNLLARNGVGDKRTQHDALVDHYVARYEQKLRFGGQGDPLRSPRFFEQKESVRAKKDAAAVAEVLDPRFLAAVNSELCQSGEQVNLPAQSLQLAAHLLTRPGERARYVCVVDSGLTVASGGGGYDTHSNDQCVVTARNFTNMINSLAAVINAPGETDPAKLDLSRTLVVLNTEFGRTPMLQEGAGGRNHHTNGYVTAFLGGPVVGRTIAGAIDENAEATTHVTPAENRMAALLALGIFPFADDSFALSDLNNVNSETDGVIRVLDRVMGVSR